MLRSMLLMCAFALLVPVSTASANKGREVKNPAADTVHYALLEGLKLLRDGKFDTWISTYCHPDDLCFNAGAKKSLLRYNLPALKRLASHCIKAGNALLVTRTDGNPSTDDTLKIFIVCNPKGMPRPFHLKKKGSAWMWRKA